jgi:hypothetical protein
MSKFNIGGLSFSSSELTWMAVALMVIMVFGYILVNGSRLA